MASEKKGLGMTLPCGPCGEGTCEEHPSFKGFARLKRERDDLRADLSTSRFETARLREAIEQHLRCYALDDKDTREEMHSLIAALEEP